MRKLILLLALLVAGITPVIALDVDKSMEAEAAFKEGDWSKAQSLFQSLTNENPKLGYAWSRLGETYRHLNQPQDALAAFEKARANGFLPFITLSRMASTHAALGQRELALSELQQIADKKLPFGRIFSGNRDFDSLVDDPAFQKVRKTIQAATNPCKYDDSVPQYRQFDFWVGDWDVFAGNVQTGTSHVERILGDCVIYENWTDRFGSQGKSFNKYNQSLKRWEQYWVDENGATSFFYGNIEGKDLVYLSDVVQPDGSKAVRKLTFFDQGPEKVRQFSQLSTDSGKTWTTEYDFTYVRRKEQAKLMY
jgi:hypothetical protein